MSFKKSLLISLVLFATVPLTIVGIISAYLTANGLITVKTDTLESLARINSGFLNQLISSQKREVKMIAESSAIVKFLRFVNSEIKDEQQRRTILNQSVSSFDSWVTSNSDYYDAILTNSNGDVISAYQTADIGKNVSDKDYFKKALQDDGAYLSDITGTILFPDSKTFAISHVVYSGNNNEKGVLVLFISVDFFENFIENIKIGSTGIAAILDSTGQIIAHPEKRWIYSDANESLISLGEIVSKGISSAQNHDKATIKYEFGGAERVLGYSFLKEPSWLFILRQNMDEITEPTSVTYSVISISLFCSLIVAIAASFFLTGVFAKPVHVLERAFARAANENLYLTCQVDSKNEFGRLAESYNTMISILNENFERLASAHEEISAQEEELRQNYDALRKEKEQNEYLVYHDATTGILNREGFTRQLKAILAKKVSGGILYIDLDDFKYVNDAWGHNYGDRLLVQFGKRLLSPQLGLEFCARIGGDEFLLVKLGGYEEVECTARNLLAAFKVPIEIDDAITYITGSIGIAVFDKGRANVTDLIKNADIAMYKAKEKGKNDYKFYNDKMQKSIARRNKIIDVLRNAICSNEVFMVYQPEIDSNSGKILAFESLMRIKSKELGVISPAEFIPIAEASNIILQIGDWAVNHVCAFAKSLLDRGVDFGVVSVNISSVQLMHPNFISKLLNAVHSSGLEPRRFQIEITESLLINSIEAISEKLNEIRAIGITVALDDFGTGYSSLNYLINLPVDVLKIDKTFINDIYTDARKQIIYKTIIDMSHELGLKIVAEGIESEQEFALLKEQGGDICQGYFFSPPVEEKDVISLIEKFS